MKKENNLQFEYEIKDEKLNRETFFEKNGRLPFDTNSQEQMHIMIEEVCRELQICDEYLIKKLEAVLKYDLPFFATTRNLARNWIVKNFIF